MTKKSIQIRNHSEYVLALERRWLLTTLLPPGGFVGEEYRNLNKALADYDSLCRLRGLSTDDLLATRRMALHFFKTEGRVLKRKHSLWQWLIDWLWPPLEPRPWRFVLTTGPVLYDHEYDGPSPYRSKPMDRIVRTADQVEDFNISGGTDSDGNAVDLGALPNKPEWSVNDPAIVAITPNEAATGAHFKYEKAGVATVSIVAKDADGNPLIQHQFEVEVTAGKLAGFAMTSDGPRDGE